MSDSTNQTKTPEEIEAEIELKRDQLAGTIDALATKLDVKRVYTNLMNASYKHLDAFETGCQLLGSGI